ncbi:hypothetical protein GCM10022409_30790 [Hymenobacter glaciei]|uniref:HTH cro/C1-type domain-containing protein n=1 Tax=Hymenobacter glaciei TaxID=877209 RepID=A0ABP7UIE8_9BACT
MRAHFGLTQAELGQYLGVAREQVAFVEAGQRPFSLAAERRLRPLSLLLPGVLLAEVPAPPLAAPDEPAEAPDTAALRKRLRRCRHEAARLRYEQENHATRALAQAQRQRGLAQLRAALLPASAAATAATAETERLRRWLDALPPEVLPVPMSATARALGAARLRGLIAEAEALEQQLAAGEGHS